MLTSIFYFSGTVGHHEKGFGVEKLDVSHDGSLIASISHDECVKFWSIKYLEVTFLIARILRDPLNTKIPAISMLKG